MNGKIIALVALFVSFSLGQYVYQPVCQYESGTNDLFNMNLSWDNVTDESGNVWFFNGCPSSASYYESECSNDALVCVIFKGAEKTITAGLIENSLYSDINYQGVDITAGSNTACVGIDARNMKTSLEYFCDPELDETVTTVETDGCYTVITINSSYVCGQQMSNDVVYDGYMPEPSDVEDSVTYININFMFLLSLGLFLFASVCCCCCVARKRRCQQKKLAAMKQFSNVAFQPIPHSTQPVKQMVVQQQPQPFAQVPSYNPYIQSQQYVYYYPMQQMNVPTPVALDVNVNSHQEQEDADEKLAKDLQAEFDRESRV